jgi:hypothetical protein
MRVYIACTRRLHVADVLYMPGTLMLSESPVPNGFFQINVLLLLNECIWKLLFHSFHCQILNTEK